jgi:hypothetical protein
MALRIISILTHERDLAMLNISTLFWGTSGYVEITLGAFGCIGPYLPQNNLYWNTKKKTLINWQKINRSDGFGQNKV